ncbi:hypothetical protein SQ54_21895 [Klebsiella pneumoniae]|jgi:hypothetical protein|nr:hypothetical protein SQ54_21895 [Klebsiella pneumoniae]
MKRLIRSGAWVMALWTMSFLLTGCVIKQHQSLSFCETASPIYISRDDVLTQETKRQILAHDVVGERVCGWGRSNHTS